MSRYDEISRVVHQYIPESDVTRGMCIGLCQLFGDMLEKMPATPLSEIREVMQQMAFDVNLLALEVRARRKHAIDPKYNALVSRAALNVDDEGSLSRFDKSGYDEIVKMFAKVNTNG